MMESVSKNSPTQQIQGTLTEPINVNGSAMDPHPCGWEWIFWVDFFWKETNLPNGGYLVGGFNPFEKY